MKMNFRRQENPEEILSELITVGTLYSSYTRGPPGQVVKRLSPERRAILETLTPEKLAKVRVDWYELPEPKCPACQRPKSNCPGIHIR